MKMSYEFRDALKDQLSLQVEAYGQDPSKLPADQRSQFIMWNVLALTDELHEALGEVGWKPWATSRHLNRELFKGELVDSFHFFMNLMIAADISAEDILEAYQAKRLRNIERQKQGYDGISGKDPVTKRALDDIVAYTNEVKETK